MADFFNEAMGTNGLETLSADQLEELIIRAQALKADQEKPARPTACPHCGSIAIKGHGKTGAGTPRMVCNDCGKAFTYSGADLHNARLSKNQLAALILGLVENKTIPQLADTMGTSHSTAHKYKIMFCDILYQALIDQMLERDATGNLAFRFHGLVQADEYYTAVSFKGKRNAEFFIFTLKRFPRHNMSNGEQDEYLMKHGLWEQVSEIPGYLQELRDNTRKHKHGISNDQTCILVTIDQHDQIIAKSVSVGRLEKEDASKILTGRLGNEVIFITDSHSSYPKIAKEEGVKAHIQILSGEHTKDGYSLASVNAVHSQMEKFFSPSQERTVATKYLNQYLALFLWNWQHKSLSLADRTLQMKRTIMDTWLKYNPSYKDIAKRPFDINTKGQFKITDV